MWEYAYDPLKAGIGPTSRPTWHLSYGKLPSQLEKPTSDQSMHTELLALEHTGSLSGVHVAENVTHANRNVSTVFTLYNDVITNSYV